MAPTEQDRIDITDLGTRRGQAGGPRTPAGPREVLARVRAAAVSQSAEDMRRVYAADAVHEFPFTRPGLPSRLEGRDEIVSWIAAGWQANALKYERYRTLAIHDTGDPDTIVVEQEVLGTSATTGEFTLPNIVVLTTRDGQIACLRDYVNILAAAAAIGT
ncbi:nuclear transport factor 2 family protein [Actinophytocola sp.]|uniref:nuclear transport factor 2 family protein n=1 Tax=Actinophytocola sp. TaxID=1872138 RepID=UPI002D48CD22|nr:nuclear transport factor 2 family protein [Actinophytocola sp.]HYQ69809.1 nuclear transport factor 2 family protein [Actinophytocola sp.]